MEQDIPDYDMDSEDERWLQSQTQRLDLTPLKFEEMMDRLEKSSGQTVVNLNEAKALLKEDDDLTIAVFDYWLNKRLKTQHPLIPSVKTEHRAGAAPNNPYLAFRRRTEKMQTRKNRKNDETSYEKMLKLRRDLHRAVTLLEQVKKREKMKRELVNLTIEVYEKRYHARDFNGAIYAEAAAIKTSRPAFTPIFHNHYPNQGWSNKAILKDEVIQRKEKRQYKKRKHKSLGHGRGVGGLDGLGALSSDEETMPQLSPEPEEVEDEGQFAFRRNKMCSYHMPLSTLGNWSWCSKEENGMSDKRFRFTLTSVSNPRRCVGFARRRMGRGGRVILDRISTDNDDFWRTLDFSIVEPKKPKLEEDIARVVVSPLTVKTETDSDSVVNNITSVNINNNNNFRTDIKSEFSNDSGTRTGESVVKVDRDEDEMVEILRSIRRDWLHFRPKTPPSDQEPSCTLLPASESYFTPGAAIEVQSLESSGILLDTASSIFLTDPFTFDLTDNIIEDVVPVTDTRQQQQQQQQQSSDKIVQTGINLNVNVGLNTLTSSVNNENSSNSSVFSSNLADSVKLEDEDEQMEEEVDESIIEKQEEDERTTIGCSKFFVRDLGAAASAAVGSQSSTVGVSTKKRNGGGSSLTSSSVKQISSSDLSSFKVNSVNAMRSGSDGSLGNTNGLLSQFGLDARTKNNKLYAYSGGVYQSVPSLNASSGTLSLHPAHTLTLNSHSANVLEIPISDDAEPVVPTKLVNTQETASTTTPATTKTKTIVRKNNLVMEVT